MKTINWGIMATGGIAHTFAKALVNTKGSKLAAAASRSIDKAKAFAGEFGAERFYGSYEELAKDPEIDIIYIATPMHSHYKDMLLCLENGKNVLCEKTITLNAAQFEACMKLAEKKNLFLMEAMWMKTLPIFKAVKAAVNDGKIGGIRLIKADFTSVCEYNKEGRIFNPALGGGSLFDLGVYNLALATSFLGTKPDFIETAAYIGETNVDYAAHITLKYQNAAAVLLSALDMPSNSDAHIIGTLGRIELGNYYFCSDTATIYDINNNIIEKIHLPFDINGYENEIIEVNDCLRNGKKQSDIIPLSDSLDIMKIMDYCRKEWGLSFPNEEL